MVNDHAIQADVYRCPDEEIRPAIIWLHGGALILGTRKWLSADQVDRYVKSGYTVVAIDYRLAPESKLPEIIEDLEDAYAWVRGQGPALFKIDPDRIALVGHSSGGYLSLMAGFLLRPRPKALVSFYGYGDLTGAWATAPDPFYNRMPAISKEKALATVGEAVISNAPLLFSPEGRYQYYLYCRQQGLWSSEVSGHDPEKERGWYSRYEPVRHVTPAYPPTMLIHGQKDTDVPFELSVRMAEILKRQGVAHEFVTNPDWGHMFDGAGIKGVAIQKAFEQLLTFLENHIR